METLLERARFMSDPPKPCTYSTLEWRNMVRELCAMLEGYSKECRDAEQVLGKALGYPWYKDDQANFPGATEKDGVCIGDHSTASIAAEAAERISAMKEAR